MAVIAELHCRLEAHCFACVLTVCAGEFGGLTRQDDRLGGAASSSSDP